MSLVVRLLFALVLGSSLACDGRPGGSRACACDGSVGEACSGHVGSDEALVCVDGRLDLCPSITNVTVTPTTVTVGADIDVAALATDGENDPITFEWFALRGRFGDATSAATTYQCTRAGMHTITVVVSDYACSSRETVRVRCVEP